MSAYSDWWTSPAPKREVVRVHAKKYNENEQHPETKKFSVDPQITSFEVIQSIISKAFNLNGQFSINYLLLDAANLATYVPLLSDWDLDAAFQMAADPCLQLRIDIITFDDGLEDWDVIGSPEIPPRMSLFRSDPRGLFSSAYSQLGRTMSNMQRSLGFRSTHSSGSSTTSGASDGDRRWPGRSPVTEREFHEFMNGSGELVLGAELRLAVYQGGLEPGLRRVVWRHLLNIFPEGLSGKDRFEYLRTQCREYGTLKAQWQSLYRCGRGTERLERLVTSVRHDVLRTDRGHKFYAGPDDSTNVVALFSLLVTFAVTHPSVGYCQGMSDLAAPLLLVQQDEGHAYLCFCSLMSRMRDNFSRSGEAVTTKFRHLSLLLKRYDPDVHAQLEQSGAGDLFFAYRWVLIELKREFPLDDALRLSEVMWASLPPSPPAEGLPLTEVGYSAADLARTPLVFNAQYSSFVRRRQKSRALSIDSGSSQGQAGGREDQGSGNQSGRTVCRSLPTTGSLEGYSSAKLVSMPSSIAEDSLLDDQRKVSEDGGRCEEEKEAEALGDSIGEQAEASKPAEDGSDELNLSARSGATNGHTTSKSSEHKKGAACSQPVTKTTDKTSPTPSTSHGACSLATYRGQNGSSVTDDSAEEVATSVRFTGDLDLSDELTMLSIEEVPMPDPSDLGHGNPFLLFLCLALILEQRDRILRSRPEYEELAMMFDRQIRRNNVNRILFRGQTLYADYLRSVQYERTRQRSGDRLDSSSSSVNLSL